MKIRRSLFFWETIQLPYKKTGKRWLASEVNMQAKNTKTDQVLKLEKRRKIPSLLKAHSKDPVLKEYLEEVNSSCLNNKNYLDDQVIKDRLIPFSNL